jgi:hypothetical protein
MGHCAHVKKVPDYFLGPPPFCLAFQSFQRLNDQVRRQRNASCKKFWNTPPSESASEKKERKNQELLCRYAALGHPNGKGAMVYVEAISEQLKTVFSVLSSK